MTTEHRQAEAYAAEAELLSRRGDVREAAELYRQAASAERQALALVPRDQVRTWSVLAVSLASLLYKSEAFSEAERTIMSLLESEALLPWAREELSELLDAVTAKPMAHQ
jgi:tetratricopeptide (TPR) repeat protein